MPYLVTVKLAKGHSGPHDPNNKVTGRCPVQRGNTCTDVTGEHHTFLANSIEGDTLEVIADDVKRMGYHVTRIEEIA